MGVPRRVANTSPLSSRSPASFILSSSWALRCFFKDLFATSGSFMDRLPLAVFGGLKASPLPCPGGQGAPDFERSRLEVYSFPLQAQDLPLPHSRSHG